MFNWIRNFARKLQVAGLNVLKGILYLICAPIVVVFMLYGCYFVIAAFLWVVLVDAAFVTLLLVFCANFFMFFVRTFVINNSNKTLCGPCCGAGLQTAISLCGLTS